MRARVAHGVRHVAGLGDDFEVRLGVEQHPQPAAHDRVVVGDDDPRQLGVRGRDLAVGIHRGGRIGRCRRAGSHVVSPS